MNTKGEARVLVGNSSINSYQRIVQDIRVELSTSEAKVLIDSVNDDIIIIKVVEKESGEEHNFLYF